MVLEDDDCGSMTVINEIIIASGATEQTSGGYRIQIWRTDRKGAKMNLWNEGSAQESDWCSCARAQTFCKTLLDGGHACWRGAINSLSINCTCL